MRTITGLLLIVLLTACGPLSEPDANLAEATPGTPLTETTATVVTAAPIITANPTNEAVFAATATVIQPKPTPVPSTPTRLPPSPTPKPPAPTSAPQNMTPLPAKAMLNLAHEY